VELHFGRHRLAARIRGVILHAISAGHEQSKRWQLLALASCSAAITAMWGCAQLSWRPAFGPRESAPAPSVVSTPLTQGPLVIHADFALWPNDQIIAELAAEQALISERLGIAPGDAQIHVHLFADEAAYRRVVAAKFPEFSNRRAIFAETGGQLAVYAHWNERVAEDLRHEVAHGYLHAAVPSLPIWLDEGLAEYFEVGDCGRGLHADHIALLRSEYSAGRWRPDLARLEGTYSAAGMRQIDYAEAWLWVHYMLDSSDASREILKRRLAELRLAANTASLSAELRRESPNLEVAILRHLDALPP
jgi:hypothetical protein